MRSTSTDVCYSWVWNARMLNARRNLSSVHTPQKTANKRKMLTSVFDNNVRFAIFFCSFTLGICIKLFETCSMLLLPAAVDAATLESRSLDRLFEWRAHSKYLLKEIAFDFCSGRLSNRQWQFEIVFNASEWAEKCRMRKYVCVCAREHQVVFL